MGHLVKDCDCCISPSTDCTDCAANCDGGGSLTLTISGFASPCDSLNGAYTVNHSGECNWTPGPGPALIQVDCVAGNWRVRIEDATEIAQAISPALFCSGDHPTGSGTMVGAFLSDCDGLFGTWTIS